MSTPLISVRKSAKSASLEELSGSSRESSKTLNNLEAIGFYGVLGEVVDHLMILDPGADLSQTKVEFEYRTLEQQYGFDEQPIYLFDPETSESRTIKAQKDRNFVSQILEEAKDEIVSSQSVTRLLGRLEDYHRSQRERSQLLVDTKRNFEKITSLSNTLEEEKQRLNNELYEKSTGLGVIKDLYEDMIHENHIKLVYLDHWENARIHQNDISLRKKEENLENVIRAQSNNHKREARINVEIEAFENELEITRIKDVEKWTRRYAKDLDAKEAEVRRLKEKRDAQLIKLEELYGLYKLHGQEIEDYLVLREQRRVKAAELERLNVAATKIQAWWRGTMYRKGLGQYRKKKGKKKGSANGKKKSGNDGKKK